MPCVSAGYIDNHWKLPKSTPIFLCDFVNIGKTEVNMPCVSAGYIDNHWKLAKSTPIFCVILLISEKRGSICDV